MHMGLILYCTVPVLMYRQATYYAVEIGTALEYLHSHGIVHADLKCQNVLMARRSAAATTAADATPVSFTPRHSAAGEALSGAGGGGLDGGGAAVHEAQVVQLRHRPPLTTKLADFGYSTEMKVGWRLAAGS